MLGMLGRKLGMTRVMQEDGNVAPVTLIDVPAGQITQIKTAEKDGYNAIVVGFEARKKPTKTSKFRRLKEFKVDSLENYKLGDMVTVELFSDVKMVKVTGTSKGRGFSGWVKRWNFTKGPESHGSHQHREPGSIGARAKPGRVIKGKKMAGHYGNVQVSLRRVPIVKIDKENNIIAIKGCVPGGNNNFVLLTVES